MANAAKAPKGTDQVLIVKPAVNEDEQKKVHLFELPAKTPVQNQSEITISSLMEKAEKLHLLKKKYEELQEKRRKLDVFELSHDNENAQIHLADANNLTFESSNPKCIKQVIDIWKEDFNNALTATEKQLRELLTA